ncbi:MAG: hypothetical protein ACHREM_20935 [Polyangiales bacterium]
MIRPLVHLTALLTMIVACSACESKNLTEEDCDHLLGRGLALVAFPKEAAPPLDVQSVKQRVRGDAKQATEGFAKACIGKKAEGLVECQRRAGSMDAFEKCGALASQAVSVARKAEGAIAKRHSTDECAAYATHGVECGAGTADDAGRFHRECDDWMEVGVYRCRLGAKNKAAWIACDQP